MFRTVKPTTVSLEINEAKAYWPFALTTEAGLVYLTREEVEALSFQCSVALKETDYNQGATA